ncbi:hypothetical protein CC80DRAFT_454359 [Byssothecium circinans]|uniref:Uncharacterized protein n=1 Tax=Byssothecium circinans TaxID=147558 RepID=A0A6A5TI79_9PLEO|nr:hypothetical protein CC80DRAFT_454359 [Byssothecium circinans]
MCQHQSTRQQSEKEGLLSVSRESRVGVDNRVRFSNREEAAPCSRLRQGRISINNSRLAIRNLREWLDI